MLGIEHWANFYEEHEKYAYVGVHIGRYYDAHGRKRAARVDFEQRFSQSIRRRDTVALCGLKSTLWRTKASSWSQRPAESSTRNP